MKLTNKLSYFLKEMVLSKSDGPVDYLSDMFMGSIPYEKKPISSKQDVPSQKIKKHSTDL